MDSLFTVNIAFKKQQPITNTEGGSELLLLGHFTRNNFCFFEIWNLIVIHFKITLICLAICKKKNMFQQVTL